MAAFSPKLDHSLKRFADILTTDEIKAIMELQENPLPTGIRLNSLKTSPEETLLDLNQRYGWYTKTIPFCENGWTIQHAGRSPGGTIEHRMGQYYLQDAASMVPVSLFNFDSYSPLILDMAASPGGKTTHLIDRSADKGFVIANDGSRSRIPALRSVLETWGGINQVITNYPGESFGHWFPETFDIVLLDAPCSMENLRPTPNHPLRETSRDERIRLQERQIQLLQSGFAALKTGGQLVYATCSLAPEEDEAVVDALLSDNPHALEILDVSKRFPFEVPGLIRFEDSRYHPDLSHALRLWPHLTGMSGFFCALIRKIDTIETVSEPPPQRPFSGTDLVEVSKSVKKDILGQIKHRYGFDLSQTLEAQALTLFKRFDQFFLIPQLYLQSFIQLPYEYIGMQLGQKVDQTLIPSHAFVSRFGTSFTKGKITLGEKDVELWIKGRDIRHPQADLVPEGQFLVVTDESGRNLGLGKLLPKRLRNMLPRSSL